MFRKVGLSQVYIDVTNELLSYLFFCSVSSIFKIIIIEDWFKYMKTYNFISANTYTLHFLNSQGFDKQSYSVELQELLICLRYNFLVWFFFVMNGKQTSKQYNYKRKEEKKSKFIKSI